MTNPAAEALREELPPLNDNKFAHPELTATGEKRASVDLTTLETLWINTGTLCNLTCENCYIESSPTNDRLTYITAAELSTYLDQIENGKLDTATIGFTGGEPFMNPDMIPMLDDVLSRGFEALVLTNAMRPMLRSKEALLDLKRRHGEKLIMRVSIDHYSETLHQIERGAGSWAPMIEGIRFLSTEEFPLHIAGRTVWKESEAQLRSGYARLFEREGIPVSANDPAQLILFPEMDETLDVPEITTACWDLLKVNPDDMMCATSRMVVKRKGAANPSVVACTLLPYDEQFELGSTLEEASVSVKLNHPHCARFCVLGGGSCSG